MKSLRSYFYRVGGLTGVVDLNLALIKAACRGQSEKINDLLDAGADVHTRKDAALVSASVNGNTDAAKVLLTAGAHAGEEAVMMAKHHDHAETAQLLKDWRAREEQKPSLPMIQPGMA
jgi:ankyrin repeat protein